MLKLTKFLGVAAVVATFALPIAASASTSNTFLTFPNFGPNVTTEVGSTVQVKDTITLTGGSELESISHQLVDNGGNNIGMPEVCENVADRVVAGTYTVLSNFDLTGGTEGTFGIRTRAYGMTGPGTDNNCGNTVNDNQYYSARVTLTEDQNTGSNANNTGGNSGSGNVGGSAPSWVTAFQAQLAALIAALKPATTTTPTPTADSACAKLAVKIVGTVQGSRNYQNEVLQGYLIGEGMSIPWLSQGATFGFYGPQTAAALGQYRAAHGCTM